MGNYEQLKAAIAAVIKANGGQEITGQVLQNTLKTLISQIGVNATFAGIATPSTTPGTPDQNVFWIASTPGEYVNFGGINVGNEVVIFQNNNGTWTAKNSGLATEAKVRDLSQNYIFVSSYYNLINPQSVTDFEDNKILLADGSVGVQNKFRVYTITNTVKENVALYVKNDFQNDILMQGVYANMALYDQNNQLVLTYILKGEKIIRVPYRYTLKISTNQRGNPQTSTEIVDNLQTIERNSNIAVKNYIFVSSYYNLINPQSVTDFEDNKILLADGSVGVQNKFRVYTITNTVKENVALYVKNDFQNDILMQGVYANMALYDQNNQLVLTYILKGEKIIRVPYRYTLKISTNQRGNPQTSTEIVDNLQTIERNSNIAVKNYIFVSSYYNLINPQSVTDFEDNKILLADGSVGVQNKFRVYTITNTVKENVALYVKNDFQNDILMQGVYANMALYDQNNQLVLTYILKGEKIIRVPYRYTLKISTNQRGNPQTSTEIVDNLQTIERNSNIAVKNYIFVSSYYNLINPQSVTDFEDNKILLADGSVGVQNKFRVYTITNTVKENVALYVKNDFQNDILMQGVYANMALYDQNNQLVLTYILKGEKIIRVPYRYTLKISTNQRGNPQTSTEIVDNKNVIDCIGDSLTSAGKYEEKLKELTGFNVINLGVSGESVSTILGRMNGIPYKVKEKITIPQTTDKVQVKLTNIYNQRLLPLLQGAKTLNVEIRGINGVLTTTQIEAEASTADYFFNRLNGGEQAEINIGENIYISTNKIYQKSERYKIIWVGQNGGFSIDETGRYQGDFNNVQDVKRYISMIKTYLGVINPNKYIVMSPPKKTSDLVENEMEKEFGANYINVRKQMVNNGISLALQYGYLVGNYPTEQDIEDINNNIVPTSLRSDTVHFNQAGYYVLAHIIYDVIKIVWDL